MRLASGLPSKPVCPVTSPSARLDGWLDLAEPGQLVSADMPD